MKEGFFYEKEISKCEDYKPVRPPLQCYKCQKFGHRNAKRTTTPGGSAANHTGRQSARRLPPNVLPG